MTLEEGWRMYNEIQDLKKIGLNKSQISRKLRISRPTVKKYINMSPEEFNDELMKMRTRARKPDQHHDAILKWLKEYHDMSAAQIYDRLEEKHGELGFTEGTVRRYVRILREEYNIPKHPHVRPYSAVEDPPMGKQMQVDFGQKTVTNIAGKRITLFAIGFVLSNSRQKYVEWQTRHLATMDIIRAHENAFEYYGGVTEEIVYDQDKLILVSENGGDLILTHEFTGYKKKRGFKIYMCRKADPESKGRIENVIGYVKNNFAHNRIFHNIDKWNEECLAWLERRANGKEHGTTKKIPAEVFIEEKKHLRPVTSKIITKTCNLSILYKVRKDNTVPIRGNRYSVPDGTYKGPDTYVRVQKTEDEKYVILDLNNDIELNRCDIPLDKGNLVRNTNHSRDTSNKVSEVMSELCENFPDPTRAMNFFEQIRKIKPRYTRDQLQLISKSIKNKEESAIEKALSFCEKNRLYSGNDFRDAIDHFSKEEVASDKSRFGNEIVPLDAVNLEKIKIKPQVRDIEEYTKLFNSNKGGNRQ